jgi:2,3-bisphosphoglycerate-independent phosphoglycerate mutase
MAEQHKPAVLIILDGWGYREEEKYNAIAAAKKPNFDRLWADCPHTLLSASSCNVGLPKGQMGNSEVGHLNLGAGRVVYQDLSRITNAIDDGSFFKNPVLDKAVDDVIKKDKALHIFGLLSDGGIHSHETHIHAMIKLAAERGAKKIYLHAFLDGRDTPPKSAEVFIKNAEVVFNQAGAGRIASLTGRFYAMDRDKRWDRVEKAYNLLTLGEADHHAKTAVEGLNIAYAAGETDEFVKPTAIGDTVLIEDGDSVIFMNYRSDRAREITHAFIDKEFTGFPRKKHPKLNAYVALTQYDVTFDIPVAYAQDELKNTLGEYLAKNGKKQLRLAETEKYAHVTFFLNGGVEAPNENEDRMLVPSPKVTTYDLSPEMSAREVTKKLIDAINSKKYDAIIVNYANCDMIGHTGNFDATVQTVECVDECLGQVISALQAVGGEALITADHGNAELMFDEATGQPHTAHTCNLVPFIYVGRKAKIKHDVFALCDIAPTLLLMLGLPIPKEMTGQSIVEL